MVYISNISSFLQEDFRQMQSLTIEPNIVEVEINDEAIKVP